MNGSGFGLPIRATEIASRVDHLYIFLVLVSLFFFVVVIGCMIYFAFKYRQGKVAERKAIEGNVPLEIFWTVVPTIILLIMFAWGWVIYRDSITVPGNAYEVKVIGKQWSWLFIHEDGRSSVNEVYVPVDRPVRFIMTSEDVLHSFFIPNFRIKQDVVPGMYTSVWFQATIPGEHQAFCAEYCGAAHSGMLAKVKVLTDEQWKLFERNREIGKLPAIGVGGMPLPENTNSDAPAKPAAGSLAAQGEKLSISKGCVACHSIDGTVKVGPSYKGVYGHEVELQDGSKVTADENYIRESIENPMAKVVKGYAPSMPTFRGQLTETELTALIAYIKSLK